MEYSAWSSGQPTNHYASNNFPDGLTEDCIHLWKGAAFSDRLWNDLPCRNDDIAVGYNVKPLCQLF